MTYSRDDSFPETVSPDHEARLNDVNRLASLAKSKQMDSPSDEAFDRAVRLATTALGAPVGLVSLVDGERQFFKAQTGFSGPARDERQTPLSHSFCQYVTTEDRLLAVDDARHHPLLRTNNAIEDLGVVAYMGVPIHGPDGRPLGSFCAIFNDSHQWSEREKQVLSDIAAMLELELSLRAETEAKQLLFEEMAHRVKNLFSIVLGMVNMSGRQAGSVEELVNSLSGRIAGLQRAHDLVRPQAVVGPTDEASTSIQNVISNLVEPHLHIEHEQMKLEGPTIQAGPKATTNLALIIHELATNAAKYGALSIPSGRVSVEWEAEDEEVLLTWHERDGPDVNGEPKRNGFGSRLIKLTAEGQLGGSFSTEWEKSGVRHSLVMKANRLRE